MDEHPKIREDTPSASEAGPLKVFINYRHQDSGLEIGLYSELKAHFGADNVFLDVFSLRPGVEWLKELLSHTSSGLVFLVLIGPRWTTILNERRQAQGIERAEDILVLEIETALRANASRVIPVLIDDTAMTDRLPRPLRPLAEIQSAQLRRTRWEDDVRRLVEQIEETARSGLRPSPEPLGDREGELELADDPEPDIAEPATQAAPRPDRAHFSEILKMLADGAVVPFLGPGVNRTGRSVAWENDSGYLPDAAELTAHLVRQFGLTPETFDLAEASQRVLVTKSETLLYKTVGRILAAKSSPTSVHRFLANLPAMLAARGAERHQLIVTSNYDEALERAFDEAREPYDLAVYLASGSHRGKFLHVPYDGDPEPIVSPNEYSKFPIDDDKFDPEVRRTIIMKIHGAVDAARGPYEWERNYVITEDHYIDYLSGSPIEGLIPRQLRVVLKDSRCLFLGYTMRDWNLRVFLHRMWQGQPLPGCGWAIDDRPDVLEKRFWNRLAVDLFAGPLDEYVRALRARLEVPPRATAAT